MDTDRSRALFDRARDVIPGGVNSPVRAFAAVGGDPRFLRAGRGAWVEDEDGRRYLDLVQSWGPLPFGHAPPAVLAAARDALERGSTFGAPTRGEVALAETIVEAVPSIERVRLTSSGTEAAMTAVRLARAATGRSTILKFAGHYHGHSDALLVAAGSGAATLGIPSSPGVTAGAAADTVVVRWNDPEAVRAAVDRHGDDLAAILCEPVPANMNLVPPADGFLALLRGEADRVGAALVFDEVISGFRVGRGGVQEREGVTPDITVLGKVVGGGFPLAAFGGRGELMDELAPTGPVYHAGTLSGNPVAVAAGLAQLEALDPAAYDRLESVAGALADGLDGVFAASAVDAVVTRYASLLGIVFSGDPPRDDRDVAAADHDRYAALFRGMLERGVYLAPSGYEIVFVSTALSDDDVARIVEVAGDVAAGW